MKKIDYENEDMDAWNLYLSKGSYENAYEICKKYEYSNKNYVNIFLFFLE